MYLNKKKKHHNSGKTRVTFLGGLESIGKNIMVIEHQNDAIIVDCGMTFPDSDMYGIDIVIPNFEYIKKIKKKIKAVVLTHGHEDHVGALGYLYNEINPPLYATKLTHAFAKDKFNKSQAKLLKTFEIKPKNIYKFGAIKIEPFYVCHSIPDGVGLIIETPDGKIVHSGDFKLDPKPLDGRMTDLARLKRLKDVSLLLCDSTNADQPGKTYPESSVGKSFEKIFDKAQGRVIIASFSSNTFRIQNAINAAHKYGRKVAIIGRNMLNNFLIAKNNGELICPPNTVIDLRKTKNIPENIVVITTGSQGEKMSALTHLSKKTYQSFKLKPSDTVVISASPIPGNEKNINKTLDRLFKLGVNIYYKKEENIHSSGHACAEEIKTLIKTVKPKYYVPIHGEYLHLIKNEELARSQGIKKQNIFILRNGAQIELSNSQCKKTDSVNGSPVLLDGNYFSGPNEKIFDERYFLSRKGILVITANDNKVILNQHGFLHKTEQETYLKLIKEKTEQLVKQYQKNIQNYQEIENKIKKDIERYLYEKTKRRPVVLVNVIKCH